MKIMNGTVWRDTDGNVLHAHGGHMLLHEGIYYWYGENRLDDIYVSCYSSRDLVNWKFENNVLTTHSKSEKIRMRPTPQAYSVSPMREDGGKINIERPKVLYNEKIKKFVMWAHFENGVDYLDAAVAIATCDTPNGDFTYHGFFRPYGEMSRDCTLFEDGGKAYFMSAARDNADMHIYRLQEDYMNVEKMVANCWSNEYREAPALVKKDGWYYCFTSYCTGWRPNQGKYARTKDLEDGFGLLTEFGDETTYRSQPAFILTVNGSETTSYVYVGDRWDADDYFNSRYTWYPIKFNDDGTAELINCAGIDIDVKTGVVTPIFE